MMAVAYKFPPFNDTWLDNYCYFKVPTSLIVIVNENTVPFYANFMEMWLTCAAFEFLCREKAESLMWKLNIIVVY